MKMIMTVVRCIIPYFVLVASANLDTNFSLNDSAVSNIVERTFLNISTVPTENRTSRDGFTELFLEFKKTTNRTLVLEKFRNIVSELLLETEVVSPKRITLTELQEFINFIIQLGLERKVLSKNHTSLIDKMILESLDHNTNHTLLLKFINYVTGLHLETARSPNCTMVNMRNEIVETDDVGWICTSLLQKLLDLVDVMITEAVVRQTNNTTDNGLDAVSVMSQEQSRNHSKGPREFNKGLISMETFRQISLGFSYCWIPLLILGIIINLINILVLMEKTMRNPTNIYLTAISIFQIGYALVVLPQRIHKLIVGDVAQRTTYFFYFSGSYLEFYIGAICLRTVYCLTMLLSLERVLAVLFPLKRNNMRLVKNPVIFIVVIFFVVFGSQTYHLFMFDIKSKVGESGKVIYYLRRKEQYNKSIIVACDLTARITFVYIPLLSLLITNIMLSVGLYRSLRSRAVLHQERSSVTISQHRTTLAILVSTCIFFLLQLPSNLNGIFAQFIPSYGVSGSEANLFILVGNIGSFFSLLSFMIDFFIYLSMCSKFRNVFLKHFSSKSKSDITSTKL